MANNKGSAGATEIVGIKQIFWCSIKNHGLCYVKFVGESDPKRFSCYRGYL